MNALDRDTLVQYNDVDYMTFVRGHFKYAELKDLDATAIAINFADSDLSLIMILPNYLKSFPEIEEHMKNYDLTKIINQMRPERIFLKIPIFQIKYQISLKDFSNKVCLF